MQLPTQKKIHAQDSLHYSAFISYRHAPADTAVAADLQKRLEHYHIPGKIQVWGTVPAGKRETVEIDLIGGMPDEDTPEPVTS